MKKNYRSYIVDNKLAGRTVPPFDHKEAEDDDTGPPEDPIYSNYVKYLWKSHTRSGQAERVDRFAQTKAR
jgi:hypothetical protein